MVEKKYEGGTYLSCIGGFEGVTGGGHGRFVRRVLDVFFFRRIDEAKSSEI